MSAAPLWTAEAMAEATGGRLLGGAPSGVTGLSIDTRTIQPGEAFFAILGEQFDGHDFVPAAAKAGAGLCVVSEAHVAEFEDAGVPILVVDDVLGGLERLAIAARARSRARIVAVTGSVGKTTTKEALRHALGAVGSVHASAASFNNHWGVPLSLARLPAETRFAVFEIGMNHAGEIRQLVGFVRPHVAIITLIAAAHIGQFRDIGEIADAKAEIFEGLAEDGVAVLNLDDPLFARLAQKASAAGAARIVTFGEAEASDARLRVFSAGDDSAHVEASILGEDVSLDLASSGRHIAQNMLAVLAAAKLLGADLAAVAPAMADWRAGKGRGAKTRLAFAGGEVTLLDESYNANPAAMEATLRMLATSRPGAGGRRVAVLGDMKELGSHSAELHEKLAGPIGAAGVDKLFLAGPEIRALAERLGGRHACEWYPNAQSLKAPLAAFLRSGDVVMIKASNSVRFGTLVEALVAKSQEQQPGEAR